MKKNMLLSCCLAIATALSVRAETIVALTSGNRLLSFDHATPGTITSTLQLTGLQPGETLLGLDFRPATGGLYALGSTSRLYLLDTTTGEAKLVGLMAFTPALNGTRFGFDFNPAVDRIRVTSDADQNMRLNPDTGAVAGTDTNLQFAASDVNAGVNPNVVGSAYSNNFIGATITVLYDIDSNVNALLIQNPPNGGTLNTMGSLGFDVADEVGFDISGVSGAAYASLSTNLYSINLQSGLATLIGGIGGPGPVALIVDIAAAVQTRLVNISTRGRVGQGEDVLIGGFITRGAARTTVVVRGIGPSLTGAGISSPLPDPVLTLYDSNGIAIATNDDWPSSLQAEQIVALGLAPTSQLESAILITLSPGSYTAIVAGKGAATGIALVEIYHLP
jgi:hypothetical protein